MTLNLAIDAVLFLMMFALGGLFVVLHLRLRRFHQEVGAMPVLADDLTRALAGSTKAMQQLAQAAQRDGNQLEDTIARAEHILQDLTYVLDRADKTLARLDGHLGTAPHGAVSTPVAAPKRPAIAAAVMPSASSRPVVASVSRPVPAQKTEVAERRLNPDPAGLGKAVVMPGRPVKSNEWARRMDTQEKTEKTIIRPSSPGFAASVYGAAQPDAATKRAGASDAELALRKALEGALS